VAAKIRNVSRPNPKNIKTMVEKPVQTIEMAQNGEHMVKKIKIVQNMSLWVSTRPKIKTLLTIVITIIGFSLFELHFGLINIEKINIILSQTNTQIQDTNAMRPWITTHNIQSIFEYQSDKNQVLMFITNAGNKPATFYVEKSITTYDGNREYVLTSANKQDIYPNEFLSLLVGEDISSQPLSISEKIYIRYQSKDGNLDFPYYYAEKIICADATNLNNCTMIPI